MIRPYTPEDKPQLIALLQLNVPQYFAASEVNDFIEYLDKYLEDYYVIELDGQVVGSGGINYFPEERQARISWDIVHPDWQGKGLGRQLMRFRINRIKENHDIDVIIVRTTQLVHSFYAKMGFELERVEPDFWAPGFDLYQMRMMCWYADLFIYNWLIMFYV